MSTTTINNIQSSLTNLQENLPAFRQYLKDNYATSLDTGQWGSESEYTPNGLVGVFRTSSQTLIVWLKIQIILYAFQLMTVEATYTLIYLR